MLHLIKKEVIRQLPSHQRLEWDKGHYYVVLPSGTRVLITDLMVRQDGSN